MMDPAVIRGEVAKLGWWHRIDLGHGIVTPGTDDSARKLARIGLPADLTGKSVLDIGAWDGFFSFESERRGAARVVAIDASWTGADGGPTKYGFSLAHRALGSKVEAHHLSVYDLDPATLGTFDVVLFLGVLYHVRDPLGALERVRSVCGGLAIIETETDMLWMRRPALGFYPGAELNDDPSNWFAPNIAALRGLVSAAGFSRALVHSKSSLPHRIGRALQHWKTQRTPLVHSIQRGRCVLHATA
jgi:tRNA (mo5U34)-methyltransferase